MDVWCTIVAQPWTAQLKQLELIQTLFRMREELVVVCNLDLLLGLS